MCILFFYLIQIWLSFQYSWETENGLQLPPARKYYYAKWIHRIRLVNLVSLSIVACFLVISEESKSYHNAILAAIDSSNCTNNTSHVKSPTPWTIVFVPFGVL